MSRPFLHSRLRRIQDNLRAYRAIWTRHADRARWPVILDRPPGQRALVLAPHPDDDIIGCGGTLSKHLEAGDSVTCVYLTNGGQGDPNCPDPVQAARVRHREAQAAAEVLGLKDLVFFDAPDTMLAATTNLVTALQKVLIERQPDLVYVPFFLDPHPDHRAANNLLAAVVQSGKFRFRCCAYETWSPLIPSVLVDISSQLERKLSAIGCYQSQIRQIDYMRLVEGLNTYRTAQFAGHIQHAEAFFLTDAQSYLALAALVEET